VILPKGASILHIVFSKNNEVRFHIKYPV
jgi:hypothetical protein